MRRPHRPLALAALAAVALGVGQAEAEAPPSSLGWVRLPGAESCIATRDLARDVEQRLGKAVFVSPAQAEVIVEGRIEAVTGGEAAFRARLTLTNAQGAVLGTRDLDVPAGSTCRSIDDQLSLVIALLIDPDAILAPRGAPSPPPVPPVPPAQPKVAPVPAPAPPTPPAPPA